LRFYKHLGREEEQVAASIAIVSWLSFECDLLKKELKIFIGIPSFLEDPEFLQSLDLAAMFIYPIWAQFGHSSCQCTHVNKCTLLL
jgi:hypothetical protein